MNRFNTESVVLKNIRYGESDKIYTVLSRDRGKISCLAKGVRKSGSRRSGNLDTLNHVILGLYKQPNGFYYINEVRSLTSFINLKSDYDLTRKGIYLAELVNRSLYEDEELGKIFILLVEALVRLEKSIESSSLTVNRFELKMMQLLGYRPPDVLLRNWKDNIDRGDYLSADLLVKAFVEENLQEKMRSLEL